MDKEKEKILENIHQLEQLKAAGAMPVELVDASIAALQAQLTTFTALVEGDGVVAQGAGAKGVAKGGILVEGNFQGNIYLGEDPAEDEKRLAIYLRMVRQATANLPLRGVDVGVSDPTQAQQSIGLANVYVDLDTKRGFHALGEGTVDKVGSTTSSE